MKKEKIVVDFMRVGKTLVVKVVKFPEELKGGGTIISDGTYVIKSLSYTDITEDRLYLSGIAENKEGIAAHSFRNVRTAKKALKRFKHLINTYNAAFASDDTTAWVRAE